MKALKIASALSLPLDAATQTFAFIARKGAGKTYTAGKLVELLIDARVQVVVLDTVGNWYGLRLAADGKGEGLDIPVLGGLRGDIPLDPAGGALIADVVVDTGRSLVLDASQWSKADRQRFATAFGERLWLRKKAEREPSPVHLVLEESQLIIPQDVRGDSARMFGVFEEIIRLGRNYGIGVSMITQRPQSVNKEVLNMAECLFVGQINGPQERDALKKWITQHGGDIDLVNELPGLPIGTFYVWSPQWLQLLERVKILPKRTFDASATPKVGDRRVQREPKPLDLTELQSRMAATIEKAKADDPRELRKLLADKDKRIKDLEKATSGFSPSNEGKKVEVLTDADRGRIDALAAELQAHAARFITKEMEVRAMLRAEVDEAVEAAGQRVETMLLLGRQDFERRLEKAGFAKILDKLQRVAAPAPSGGAAMPLRAGKACPHFSPAPAKHNPAPKSVLAMLPRGAASGHTQSTADLSPAEERMLDVVRETVDGAISRRILAIRSGYALNGGGFRNTLSSLRTRGYVVDVPGGAIALGDRVSTVQVEPWGDRVHEIWRGKLSPVEYRMLDSLARSGSGGLSRQALAEQNNYDVNGGGFRNTLSALNSSSLIDKSDGRIFAHEEFWR